MISFQSPWTPSLSISRLNWPSSKRLPQTEQGRSASSRHYNHNVEAPYTNEVSTHVCLNDGYLQRWYFGIPPKLCRPYGHAALQQLYLLIDTISLGLTWELEHAALTRLVNWTYRCGHGATSRVVNAVCSHDDHMWFILIHPLRWTLNLFIANMLIPARWSRTEYWLADMVARCYTGVLVRREYVINTGGLIVCTLDILQMQIGIVHGCSSTNASVWDEIILYHDGVWYETEDEAL